MAPIVQYLTCVPTVQLLDKLNKINIVYPLYEEVQNRFTNNSQRSVNIGLVYSSNK